MVIWAADSLIVLGVAAIWVVVTDKTSIDANSCKATEGVNAGKIFRSTSCNEVGDGEVGERK